MSPILGIWASAQQGALQTAFDSIQTVTVGAGGLTTVSFTSIPSTYSHLQLRVTARGNLAAANIYSIVMNFNGDSGTNYSYHNLQGNGSSTTATGAANYTASYVMNAMGTNTSNTFATNIVDILDYSNTNKIKTVRSLTGGDVNGSGVIQLSSSLWNSTTAINSISLSTGGFGDFLQYSSFALYGIKG